MKFLILACLMLAGSYKSLAQGTIRDVTDESSRGSAPAKRAVVRKGQPSGSDVSSRESQPQQEVPPAILSELATSRHEADSLRTAMASLHQKLPTELDARQRYQTAVDYAWKILIGWLVLIVAYLVWAIHRYVYNYGLSNKEWKVLYPEIYETWWDRIMYRSFGRMANLQTYRERREEMVGFKIRLRNQQAQAGNDDTARPPDPEPTDLLPEPDKNPYEKDSFGLPSGSVRGILALTALVMFMLVEGVNLYAPGNLEDQFGGLVTALQMVLAFYFGSKAVEVLQARTAAPKTASPPKAVFETPPPPVESQPPQAAVPQVAAPVATPSPQAPAEQAVLPASVSRSRFANLIVLSSDKSSSPPPTNALSDTTPLAKRVLALTASIETGAAFPNCFAGVTGNFDGMGISFGALQWNIGQGSLQTLWKEMRETHETELITVLGDLYKDFSRMLDSSKTEQMQWALGIQRQLSGRANAWQIVDKWKSALQALGRSPGMIDVQVRQADSFFHIALASCKEYGLTVERGAALMFDIRVQNGSVDRGGAGDKIRADFELLNPSLSDDDAQVERMRIIARRRSEVSSSQWKDDVLTRKMTIAEGTGKIHGRSYDLGQEFFIGLRSLTAAPPSEETPKPASSVSA